MKRPAVWMWNSEQSHMTWNSFRMTVVQNHRIVQWVQSWQEEMKQINTAKNKLVSRCTVYALLCKPQTFLRKPEFVKNKGFNRLNSGCCSMDVISQLHSCASVSLHAGFAFGASRQWNWLTSALGIASWNTFGRCNNLDADCVLCLFWLFFISEFCAFQIIIL